MARNDEKKISLKSMGDHNYDLINTDKSLIDYLKKYNLVQRQDENDKIFAGRIINDIKMRFAGLESIVKKVTVLQEIPGVINLDLIYLLENYNRILKDYVDEQLGSPKPPASSSKKNSQSSGNSKVSKKEFIDTLLKFDAAELLKKAVTKSPDIKEFIFGLENYSFKYDTHYSVDTKMAVRRIDFIEFACDFEALECLKFLSSYKEDWFDVNETRHFKNIEFEIEKNLFPFIERFLKEGKTEFARTLLFRENKITSLYFISKNISYILAFLEKNTKALESFIQCFKGAGKFISALYFTSYSSSFETAVRFFVGQDKLDPNTELEQLNGNKLLHLAAQNSNVGLIKLLLEKGADLHALNNNGHRPLYIVKSCSTVIPDLRERLEAQQLLLDAETSELKKEKDAEIEKLTTMLNEKDAEIKKLREELEKKEAEKENSAKSDSSKWKELRAKVITVSKSTVGTQTEDKKSNNLAKFTMKY